jgi:FAD/FMN-containing dehydrogenase
VTGGVRAVALDLDRLRSSVRGRVVAPGDGTYDADRIIMFGGIDPHPLVIVRVADAADVATVIGLARETGLDLAVRSGGHSAAAHSTVDGGIVLDVRDLRELDVDTDGRTAWVGSGLTAGEITTALAEHGLAIGFGDTGSVGVAGITLGGGIGYLVRSQGMTIDNLLAVELVTADGEVRTVDETSDPELFWGLRGGGGNFGIATRFRFRLHEVPQIVGGLLIQPATEDAIVALMDAGKAAPEALSFIANVMTCPPMPFVPESVHGQLVIFSLVCWSGPVEEADAALAPIRSAATPIADMLQPQGYPAMYGPEDPDYHPLAVSRNLFMDHVDAADARVMLEQLAASDAPMRAVQLRPLGGAMARIANDATAFGHRDRAVMVNVAAFYTGPEDKDAKTAWVDGLTDALRDGTAAYVNFIGDEGPERIHDAYPGATYDRLAAIKRRYDPENLFRRNQNVEPALA